MGKETDSWLPPSHKDTVSALESPGLCPRITLPRGNQYSLIAYYVIGIHKHCLISPYNNPMEAALLFTVNRWPRPPN